MIIRESGVAAASPQKPAWPPRSPLEALMSSPSGRKRLERLRRQGSPTPTPSPRKTPGSRHVAVVEDEDQEEDEETLQLQLEAIEARLKLKKLQQAKAQGTSLNSKGKSYAKNLPDLREAPAKASRFSPERTHREVLVPLSPAKVERAIQNPSSPSRIILGIDKGLRANDVSLKRASSLKIRDSAANIRTRRALFPLKPSISEAGSSILQADRPKSFSERLAESRQYDRERQDKQERTQKAQSRGFGVKAMDISHQDDAAMMPPPSRPRAKSASTSDASESHPHAQVLRKEPRARTVTGQTKTSSRSQYEALLGGCTPHSRTSSDTSTATIIRKPKDTEGMSSALKTVEEKQHYLGSATSETSSFESFSGLHLSKRLIPHTSLTRTLSSKEIFTIPHLLKVVKSPDYETPDVEGDYVVFGIIASKSSPRNHANMRKMASTADEDETGRSKWMSLRLTDLKWEIDLYLFDTGFEHFWKLTLGTVIAILNPGIMPPRPSQRNTGQFSLKLASSEDTVLEIGTARDLGFCKAVRKDGQECGQWVDNRHTEVCEFHIYLQMEQAKKGRMQVNTMSSFGAKRGGKSEGAKGRGLSGGKEWRGGGAGAGSGDYGLLREGKWHDRYLHETVYIAPNSRGNTAALLDAEDAISTRGFKNEMRQKRLAEQEKERELARELGNQGSGMGAEYARLRTLDNKTASSSQTPNLSAERPASAALDLLGVRASDVHLGPVKRKRGQASSASEPRGWGGAFTRDLLSPSKVKNRQESENLKAGVKKKARFMTDKGIRESGRESLPSGEIRQPRIEADEEDDLDIV